MCKAAGRIAYKRTGGSRLITANDHWKSQIRHALYTGDRFQRCGSVPGALCLAPASRPAVAAAPPPPPTAAPCSARSVQANQDLWQLAGEWATATPQLCKVLVRADESGPDGAAICAAVAVPASATGEARRAAGLGGGGWVPAWSGGRQAGPRSRALTAAPCALSAPQA